MPTSPGTPLLEYFPKELANCPDSLVFRILQDSMAKMQDSMALPGVRGRSFSHAGETVHFCRQDSMGQYGRLIFGITGRSRFTENSPPEADTAIFPDLLSVHDGAGTGREMWFCQGVPGLPPTLLEKISAEPPCLMGEGVGRQPPPFRPDPIPPDHFWVARCNGLSVRDSENANVPGPVHCCIVFIFWEGGSRATPPPPGKKYGRTPPPHWGGGRPATPPQFRTGIRMLAGVLPVSGYRAMAEGEGGLAMNPPGNLKKINAPEICSRSFSGFLLLLPEDVVRTGNRGKRTRKHRDQDEPDGKVRDQRAGTAHDTGNLE
jgi:hypothetical protein